MTSFHPAYHPERDDQEKRAGNTPEAQFLHNLSFELWLSGYQTSLLSDQTGNADLIRKLHYLSGFVSFRPDWHGVYAKVIRMVEEQQRTVKIPNDINVEQVSDILNKAGMSFTIKGKHKVIINPYADIHDDLLGVLTGMKHQVDNLGDFSNKLQDKLIALIGKAVNPEVSYKCCLQKIINSIASSIP